MGLTTIVSVLLLTPVVLVCVRMIRVRSWGHCRARPALRGRTALVTGAASGLGYATARSLAALGATVVLACRDAKRASDAKKRLLAELPEGADLVPMAVDLGSLESVREFAARVLNEVPQLHILVCNAGVYFPINKETPKTKDGLEVHLGVNHLSHFLLTQLLMPRLKESAPSRVVVVASSLFEKSVNSFSVANIPPGYSSSKLANVFFAKEMAARTAGSGVNVYAVCPGFCYTGLFRSRKIRWYHYALMAPVAFFFMRTAEQGAQTILHCSLSKEVEGESGLIYKDCSIYKPKNKLSPQIASELWIVSERMVGLRPALVGQSVDSIKGSASLL